MDGRFNSNPFVSEQEEPENSPENSGDSTPSPVFNDAKMSSSSSSPKRSRRAMQKRVVSVPIKDVEGSRLKGEFAPPSDSWAWRKYGQKPIKGSPYPRGYYRCSSSKGCPARKQVERSRVDPTMLLVTYSCEHNHPWPASRNHHNSAAVASAATPPPPAAAAAPATPPPPPPPLPSSKPVIFSSRPEPDPDEKFPDLGEQSLITTEDFTWFSDFESPSSTMLESPIFAENNVRDADVAAMFFPMGEEDESLFADLGELPECALVFRRGVLEMEDECRRRTTPICGTTS